MTNEEIQAIFFLECEEALVAAENGLTACRDGSFDSDTINAIFRAVHSIKGGAGAFGYTALQAYTHAFETLLSDVRDETIAVTPPLVALMLRALDGLSDHVTAARDGGTPANDAALVAELEAAHHAGGVAEDAPSPSEAAAPVSVAEPAVTDGFDFDLDAMLADISEEVVPDAAPEQTTGEEADQDWSITIRPTDAALANGGEPILLLRELELLGGNCVAVSTLDVPLVDDFNPDAAWLSWTFRVPAKVAKSDIEDVFDFVGESCVVAIVRGDAVPDAAAPVAELLAAAAVVIAPPAAAPALAAVAAAPEAAATAPAAPQTPKLVAASAEPSAPAGAAAAAAPAGQSIRIDLAKLDRLIDVVGELVIAQAMMEQRLASNGMSAIEELAMLDGLTRDIRESAMAIRAQPIGSVFSRVPRMLRELESSTGKRVRLEMAGEATELDKTVIERLGEPLTHLVRNAVDHGIESPADRLAAGKSAEGVLRLFAEQRGGRIFIRLSDDGRGIDRVRVLAKAIERGLVQAGTVLSDEEIDNLIFAPGFSTAAAITDISGRGVGMDVVRQNVKDLGGRVTVESTPGHGSVFTLALPLTLAISDGMIVTVGDQVLVVPLAHVVENLRPMPNEVERLGAGRQMLSVRGRFIPILPLADQVGAVGAIDNPTDGVLVIVDTEGAGQAALQVDTILDQRQFVIKSLDANFRPVEGVAGATVLGDGRVALILDIDAVVAGAVMAPLQVAA